MAEQNPGYFSLDPNRDWPVDNSPSNLQSTQLVRDMLATDMGTNRASFALDFHGTWGSSVAFFYHDSDALYKNSMDEALEVVGGMYDAKPSTVIPDTTMSGGVYRLCGNPLHCYTPEIYETSLFAGGISDLFLIGEHFAKAIALISDVKMETFKLPSNVFILDGTQVEGGITWSWI